MEYVTDIAMFRRFLVPMTISTLVYVFSKRSRVRRSNPPSLATQVNGRRARGEAPSSLRARSARAVYHLSHCPAGPRARRQHRHSRGALNAAKRSEALAKIGIFHIVPFRETPRRAALFEPLPGCRVEIVDILFAALHESASGTSLPKRCAALCLELVKADVHLTGIRRLTEQMQLRAPSASTLARPVGYSMTSSARARSVGGTSSPRAFAVFRLITSS
jgi:hypothetical protein